MHTCIHTCIHTYIHMQGHAAHPGPGGGGGGGAYAWAVLRGVRLSNLLFGSLEGRGCSRLNQAPSQSGAFGTRSIRRLRNRLSNTTCLAHVFFNSGEQCSKLRRPLTLYTAHNTNEAVLDK